MKTLDAGVSVVVPVYHSTDSLRVLVPRVNDVLIENGFAGRFEIILVDDGSPSSTWNVVKELSSEHHHVHGLRLGRNVGQHNALVAGVRHARYDVTVTMDDDLQNPPEEIPKLLKALTDDFDVVYATPQEIAQKAWRRLASVGIRKILAASLGAESALRLSSFRAFRTQIRQAFEESLGPAVSLDALLSWGTSRFTSVEVDHQERSEGSSNYTVRSLFKFAIDTATGYSTVPLQIASTIGMLTVVFGVCVLVWVIGRTAIMGASVPGFTFLASIITIFAGAQLMALGILGEYIARMHFRMMRKPSYVVAERNPDGVTDRGERAS